MQWIAPSERDTASAALEKQLWDAADPFRANSGLKSQEYSAPVLGLIFLRFAAIVVPSIRFIYKRHPQIQNLRRTRELPRLLSRQVHHLQTTP